MGKLDRSIKVTPQPAGSQGLALDPTGKVQAKWLYGFPNTAAKVYLGDGTWGSVTESQLGLTDVTTDNVSTARHGFAPKAPNDVTKFLDGTGAYSDPLVRITKGAGTVTFAGSPVSATTTVAHGLGTTPTSALVCGGAGTASIGFNVANLDATNISVIGYEVSGGALTGAFGFYWMADK